MEPSRKFADIIVLEGGRNLVALEMIMQRIRTHIDTPLNFLKSKRRWLFPSPLRHIPA